jgi:hypothetical protein
LSLCWYSRLSRLCLLLSLCLLLPSPLRSCRLLLLRRRESLSWRRRWWCALLSLLLSLLLLLLLSLLLLRPRLDCCWCRLSRGLRSCRLLLLLLGERARPEPLLGCSTHQGGTGRPDTTGCRWMMRPSSESLLLQGVVSSW